MANFNPEEFAAGGEGESAPPTSAPFDPAAFAAAGQVTKDVVPSNTPVSVEIGNPTIQSRVADTQLPQPTRDLPVEDSFDAAMGGINKLFAKYVQPYTAPIVNAAQEEIGKPVVNAVTNTLAPVPGTSSLPFAPKTAAEAVARAHLIHKGLNWMSGEEDNPQEPSALDISPEAQQNRKTLQLEHLGRAQLHEDLKAIGVKEENIPMATHILEGAAKMIGQAPAIAALAALTEGGSVLKSAGAGLVEKEIPFHEALINHAIMGGKTGIALGTAESLKKGDIVSNTAHEAVTNALMASGAYTLSRGVKSVLGGIRKGMISGPAKEAVLDSINQSAEGKSVNKISDLSPSAGVWKMGENGPEFKIVELNSKGEIVKYHDMPASTPVDIVKIKSAIEDHHISTNTVDDVLLKMTPEQVSALTGPRNARSQMAIAETATRAKGRGGEFTQTSQPEPFTEMGRSPETVEREIGYEFGKVPGTKVESGRHLGTEELPTPLHEAEIHQDGDHVKLVDGHSLENELSTDSTQAPAPSISHQINPDAVVPLPHEVPTWLAARVNTVKDFLKARINYTPDQLQKLMSRLTADTNYGDEELRNQLMKLRGSEALSSNEEVYRRAINKALPTGITERSPEMDVLGRVARNELNWNDLVEQHPHIAQGLKDIAPKFIDEIRNNHNEIVKLGGAPNSDIIPDNVEKGIPTYLARMYLAHQLPKGEWAKHAPEEAIDNLINFIVQKHIDSNRPISKTDVTDQILDILHADDPVGALKSSPLAAPMKHLMKRNEDLPEVIRKALGEETSGAVLIPHTLAKQEAIINTLKTWRDLSNDGTWIKSEWSPSTPLKIPDDPAKYGMAASKYAHPQFEQLLHPEAIQSSSNQLAEFLTKGPLPGATRLSKRLILGYNPTAQINNIGRNIPALMKSGGLDPLRPIESGRSLANAIEGYAKWRSGKVLVADNPIAPIIKEMQQYGVLPSGFGASEMRSSAKEYAMGIEKAFARENKTDGMWDKLSAFAKSAQDTEGKAGTLASEASDFADNVSKLTTYLSLRPKYIRQFSHEMDLAETDPAVLTAAAKKAAIAVKNYFPDFSNPGPLAQAAKKYTGLVSPFITGALEEARVNAGIVKRAMIDLDPESIANLTKTGLVMSGAIAGVRAKMRANGVSDSQVDAAYKAIPDNMKRYHFLVPIGTNSKGGIDWYDASRWVTELQMLTGDPRDSFVRRFAANTLGYLSQNSPFNDDIQRGLAKTGLIHPPPDDPKIIEGQASISGALAEGMKKFIPVVGTAQSVAQKTGLIPGKGKFTESMTPSGGIQKMAGLPLTLQQGLVGTGPTPATSERASMVESKGRLNEYGKQMKSVLGSMRTPEEKRHLVEAIKEARRAEIEKVHERSTAISTVRKERK